MYIVCWCCCDVVYYGILCFRSLGLTLGVVGRFSSVGRGDGVIRFVFRKDFFGFVGRRYGGRDSIRRLCSGSGGVGGRA